MRSESSKELLPKSLQKIKQKDLQVNTIVEKIFIEEDAWPHSWDRGHHVGSYLGRLNGKDRNQSSFSIANLDSGGNRTLLQGVHIGARRYVKHILEHHNPKVISGFHPEIGTTKEEVPHSRL